MFSQHRAMFGKGHKNYPSITTTAVAICFT